MSGASSLPSRRSILATSAAAGAASLLPAQMAASAKGAADDGAIRPFRVDFQEEQLVDLRRRIAATHWPDKETVADQFQGVDQIDLHNDGSFEVLERVEGGKHQLSVCTGTPAVLGWATGNLAEPRNNPQVGMANMRTIMPALAKAKAAKLEANGLRYLSASLPKQQRTTRVVKDLTPDQIAAELVEWIGAE